MKTFLTEPPDVGVPAARTGNSLAVEADLGLAEIFEVMADGDQALREAARQHILSPLVEPDHIRYRQGVLRDFLNNPTLARGLYELALEGILGERNVYRSFRSDRPSRVLERSVEVLVIMTDVLRRIGTVIGSAAATSTSVGLTSLAHLFATTFDDDYLSEVDAHLGRLRFSDGLLARERLSPDGAGSGQSVLRPSAENRGLFGRLVVKKPVHSFTIPPRDEAGFTALADLRDRTVAGLAATTASAVDSTLELLRSLRDQLAFYLGCLNLHAHLSRVGMPVCFPEPLVDAPAVFSARGLYDPGLAIGRGREVVTNDLEADDVTLIVVTGANQGGKSTFLRSIGIATLMMQSGMFVPAQSYRASVSRAVFTHFKRDEDAGMRRGRFDEELARMSSIVDEIGAGAMLLSNESFAATNEREGSEIGVDVIRALTDMGVRVVAVTHLFELAAELRDRYDRATMFLRAERRSDGSRTFRVLGGMPEPTSFGTDLYDQIFVSSTTEG